MWCPHTPNTLPFTKENGKTNCCLFIMFMIRTGNEGIKMCMIIEAPFLEKYFQNTCRWLVKNIFSVSFCSKIFLAFLDTNPFCVFFKGGRFDRPKYRDGWNISRPLCWVSSQIWDHQSSFWRLLHVFCCKRFHVRFNH